MIPARKIGQKIELIPDEQVERIGTNIGAIIEGLCGGTCALSALAMGRLSLRANCEREWLRLNGLEVMEGFRKGLVGKPPRAT